MISVIVILVDSVWVRGVSLYVDRGRGGGGGGGGCAGGVLLEAVVVMEVGVKWTSGERCGTVLPRLRDILVRRIVIPETKQENTLDFLQNNNKQYTVEHIYDACPKYSELESLHIIAYLNVSDGSRR